MEKKLLDKSFLNVCVKVCVLLVYLLQIRQTSGSACGTVDLTHDLIRGGNEAAKGQWPFIVALYQVKRSTYICGGSIISKKHILTAAHCIQKKNSYAALSPHDLVVLLGAHNITATAQNGIVTSNVTEIYVHPEWDPYDHRFDADLAILVLDHGITFNKHIRPICMPTDSTDINGATIDVSGTIVGWGLSTNTNMDEIPRLATMKALNDSLCYKVDNAMATFTSNRTFCGGLGDGIPEHGDSGGGFYVLSDRAWVQYGIIAAIRTDATGHVLPDSIAVYTNVRAFKNWIEETVKQTEGRVSEVMIYINVTVYCFDNVTDTMYGLYGCTIDDLDIKKENAAVEKFSTYYANKKKSTDVDSLLLRHGSVISLPTGLGVAFPNVKAIHTDLSFSINVITRSSFLYFENLENLIFNCSQIDVLDEDSFWDLPNLNSIAIQNTQLRMLDEKVFDRSEQLTVIYLSSNEQLETLPRNLLKNNLILEEVFLGNNSLRSIDEEMFQFNANIFRLSLSKNRLESIPRNLFRNNSHLQVVDISHNFLQTIDWDLFERNFFLVYVDLSNNFLKTIDERTFERNFNLQFLYLSSNGLEALPQNLFLNNFHLHIVDLNNNSIRAIDEETFETNIKIREVFLQQNKIEHLPPNLFNNHLLLGSFRVGENLLQSIDEHFFQANIGLKAVDLQMNKLESLPGNLFRNNLLLEYVTIDNNSLKTIDEHIFRHNLNLKEVHLSLTDLKVLPANLFQENSLLTYANLGHNSFSSVPDNLFQTNTKLKVVILTSNQLDSLQVNLFTNNLELKLVDLSNNSIKQIEEGIFETNTQLTFIDFTANKIEKLSKNLFTNKSLIQKINFNNNFLNLIEFDFTELENVEEISFYNNSCVNAMYSRATANPNLADFQIMLGSNCTLANLSSNSK